MKEEELKKLEGKIIKSIEMPEILNIKVSGDYSPEMQDDNLLITFTDGTIFKLASWDYEGYSSGIYKEIINQSS